MTALASATRAEFTKVLTTRMWWLLALILVLYVAVSAAGVGFALGFGSEGSGMPGDAIADMLPPLVYSLASSVGYVFPLLIGALAVTNEFRHQTLTPTFLATPRRGRVLVAKILTLLVFGALFGVLALLASVGVGALAMSVVGIDPQLGDIETWLLVERAVLAMALWAVIGVGLGVLVPSQVGSIVIVLAFTQFVEPLLRTAAAFVDWLGTVGQYLPGAASDTLVGSSFFTVIAEAPGGADGLEWWQGGLVLAAYAAIFAVAGYFVSWRRDVT